MLPDNFAIRRPKLRVGPSVFHDSHRQHFCQALFSVSPVRRISELKCQLITSTHCDSRPLRNRKFRRSKMRGWREERDVSHLQGSYGA
ncbi:hypothetical protein NPIL_170351 [Nephila pilipes]|uniref:Uncharacterized protein n=1 Tax=Nephila pilipes TaxID=299642 RepID=A0A8X6NYP1_NEPPI|nr:hypothetical protein NPIL_170351 [Nephila pilipes]